MDAYDSMDKKIVELRAENKRLKERSKRSPWRPIKTAPKDDTVVDIYSNRWGRLTLYKRVDLDGDGNNVFYDPATGCGMTVIRDATHWMPVPSAPERGEK